jgi:hypothetical protein
VVFPEHGNPVNQTVKLIPDFSPFSWLRFVTDRLNAATLSQVRPVCQAQGAPRACPFLLDDQSRQITDVKSYCKIYLSVILNEENFLIILDFLSAQNGKTLIFKVLQWLLNKKKALSQHLRLSFEKFFYQKHPGYAGSFRYLGKFVFTGSLDCKGQKPKKTGEDACSSPVVRRAFPHEHGSFSKKSPRRWRPQNLGAGNRGRMG